MFTENKTITGRDIGGGVTRKVLSYSRNLMTVELECPAGSLGAQHAHPQERSGDS